MRPSSPHYFIKSCLPCLLSMLVILAYTHLKSPQDFCLMSISNIPQLHFFFLMLPCVPFSNRFIRSYFQLFHHIWYKQMYVSLCFEMPSNLNKEHNSSDISSYSLEIHTLFLQKTNIIDCPVSLPGTVLDPENTVVNRTCEVLHLTKLTF